MVLRRQIIIGFDHLRGAGRMSDACQAPTGSAFSSDTNIRTVSSQQNPHLLRYTLGSRASY